MHLLGKSQDDDGCSSVGVEIVAGVVAWFATRFIGALLVDFHAIRNEAAQAFHFYANVPGIDGMTDAREEGRAMFRRLAGRRTALECFAGTFGTAGTISQSDCGSYRLFNAIAGNRTGNKTTVQIVKAKQGLKLPVDHDQRQIYERQGRFEGVKRSKILTRRD